jgi:hypothetical protein
MPEIGTLAERELHAALKAYCSLPGDALEHRLGGFVIDIVRGLPDAPSCIEIQTRSLAKLRPKLLALLDEYPIRLVYPIARERLIVRVDADGAIVSRRRSPRHGTAYDLFAELVSFPGLMTHPNLTLELLFVREEQVWVDDGRGSWRRRRWSIHDRRLLDVIGALALATPADFATLLPAGLPSVFDTEELARAIARPRHVAQKMAYCLRAMGVLELADKRGRSRLYRLA